MKPLGHCARSGRLGTFRLGYFLAGLMFVVVWALPASAQQSPPSAPPAPSAPAPAALFEVTRDYVIGPQDLLQISILESPELSREVRVNADGTISLPLLDRFIIAGMTLYQAEDLLVKKYKDAGVLNDPNITVSVKDLQSKPVTVMGAVRNPGVFQITGQSRLLRILTQAGGVTDEAGSQVQVIRAGASSSDQVVRVRMEDVKSGALEANIPIYGGDTVNAVPAGAVYVVGAVNRPGRHVMGGDTENMTVLRVIAVCEDLKRTAKGDKAVLIRRDASGTLTQIPVDIKKIMSRQQPDVAVMANDVLFVPDSAAKRAFTRGLESALQVATGIAILGVR